jgi:mercuric ion transport protein
MSEFGTTQKGGRPVASSLAAAGAAASGAGASLLSAAGAACCAGPGLATLLGALLGAGGAAWAVKLQPYSPYLSAGSLLLIGAGFWSTRRSRHPVAGEVRRRSGGHLFVRALLWLAGAIWVASISLQLQLHLVP